MARVVAYYRYHNEADPPRDETACRIVRRAIPYLGFPAFVVSFLDDQVERIAISEQLEPYYDLVAGDEDGIFGNPFG